jgi:hypothetical protein
MCRIQVGRKPTSSTVVPIATQAVRQSAACITKCAISGIATRPIICASVAIEVAKARRRTNQLTTEP